MQSICSEWYSTSGTCVVHACMPQPLPLLFSETNIRTPPVTAAINVLQNAQTISSLTLPNLGDLADFRNVTTLRLFRHVRIHIVRISATNNHAANISSSAI